MVGAGGGVEVGGKFVDFAVLMGLLVAPGLFNDGVLSRRCADGFRPDPTPVIAGQYEI